jgi:hypothetical protein
MSMTVDAQPEQPTSIDLEPRILGDAGEALYAEINACRDDAQLDRIASRIWHIRSQDQLTDAAADYLQHCVIRRRPPQRNETTHHERHPSVSRSPKQSFRATQDASLARPRGIKQSAPNAGRIERAAGQVTATLYRG